MESVHLVNARALHSCYAQEDLPALSKRIRTDRSTDSLPRPTENQKHLPNGKISRAQEKELSKAWMSILILWPTGQALSEVVSAFLENADEAAEVLTHPPHNEDALSLSRLKTSQPTANRTFQQKSSFLQGYRMNFPHFFTCPYL